MPSQRYNVVIPGEISDAIVCNSEYFESCQELLALANRSIQTMGRISYKRKWSKCEIETAIQAIDSALCNTTKYKNKSGNEYQAFLRFREKLRSSLNVQMKYTTYDALLEFAENEADSFSLTWRNFPFEHTAFDLVDELAPWLISDFSSNAWPGTELFGEKARVKTYEVDPQTIDILRVVASVYDWKAPRYPEDLAFYKSKRVLFGSVAHEGYAWFSV